MSYRRRASPLHAARAASAIAYCVALAACALISTSPIMLAATAGALLCTAVGAGVGREVRRAAFVAVPAGLLVAAVNALVTRDGETVIARLGDLPVLGRTDITLEATAYGGVLGLRAALLVLLGALYTVAIDPDDVLRLFRRLSFRSALTATLATRIVPVLWRDGRRLADAQRCRPGPPPGRAALLRASTAGALDRALDVAAALEVRGYGAARRSPRVRAPYSRHDLAFALSALTLGSIALAVRIGGLAGFSAYPVLHAPVRPLSWAAAGALVVVAALPFADRRGIEP